MIEFRFKINYSKSIDILNRYAPTGKEWKVDKFTGEWWIKITTKQNTQGFNDYLLMFLQLNDAESSLQIKDCNTSKTSTAYGKERPSLFG